MYKFDVRAYTAYCVWYESSNQFSQLYSKSYRQILKSHNVVCEFVTTRGLIDRTQWEN
jgi:hypothetical protein